MHRTQLLFVFLVLFLLLFLFPLFWSGTLGRAIIFPLYLMIGPLLATAIVFEGLGKGGQIKDAVQERLSLLPIALLMSFAGALFFAVVSFLSLLFEWLVLIPVLGALIQVFFIGWPLLMTLLLIGGLLLSLLLIFFVAPIIQRTGWHWHLISKELASDLKRSWFIPFLSAVGPVALAIFILWLAFPSVYPYLLAPQSPFFVLQWLFLTPLIALFLAYPMAYFFDQSSRWSSSPHEIK
jgi:hypothetical protein